LTLTEALNYNFLAVSTLPSQGVFFLPVGSGPTVVEEASSALSTAAQ